MAKRRKFSVLAGTLIALAIATAAFAYWTANGTGSGNAALATLDSPATVTASSLSVATAHVTWQPVSAPSGTASDVTFTVDRSSDGGLNYSPTSGPTCSGTLVDTTTDCDDSVSTAGDYVYLVTAHFRTWTSSAVSNSVYVVVDTTPPTSSITLPVNGAAYNAAGYTAGCTPGTDEICGTATDPGAGASGVNKVQVTIQRASDSMYWNGAAWGLPEVWNNASGTTSWFYLFSSSNLTDGDTYTVGSQAIDNASNTQTTPDSKTFAYDVTNPITASVTSPPGGSQFRASTAPASFSGSVSDNLGGVGMNADGATYTLRRSSDNNYWTGAIWQVAVANLATTHSATTSNSAVSWTSAASMPTWAFEADGLFTVQATATDKAGNTFTGTAISFTLDKTSPSAASVTSPANGSITGSFPSTFSGSTADNSGGVGLNANSATYTLQRSTDNRYWTGSAWQVAAASLATAHSATTSNTAASWTSSATMPSGGNVVDGTYTIQASATDKAGNSLSGSAISFTLDRVNPITASVTSPPGGSQFRASTVPAIFAGSVADNSGGVGMNVDSATYTLRRSSDNNYWTGAIWQVAVANLATTHAATTSNTAAAWTSAAAMPTWAFEADGAFTIQARATDKASNAFTGTAITFTLDKTNPIAASVTSPANGSFTNSFPSTFTGSAADNSGGVGLNANSTTYTLQRSTDNNYWSGSAWQVAVANLTTTHSATTSNNAASWTSSATMPSGGNLVDGTYTIQATATDKVGNTFTGSAISFTLERVNPITASVTSPADGSSANTFPSSFSGSVADNSGGVGMNANTASYTLQRSTDSRYWTGSAWQVAVANLATTHSATTGNTAATWTSSATMPNGGNLVDATYTIQAKATDKAGNTFTGSAITFILDKTNPITALVSTPANGAQFRAATVPATFSGSAQDNSGGLGLNANSTTFTLKRSSDNKYWDGSSSWTVAVTNLAATHVATTGNTSVTWTSAATMPTWSSEAEGTFTVQATVTDKVANNLTGTAVAFTLDKTNPITASVTSPVDGSSTNTFPTSFTGSVADNSGGLGLNANTATYTLQRSTDSRYWTGSAWQVAAANLATTHSATTGNTAATWTSSATMPSGVNLVDATYTIQATATDKVGNSLSGSAITFILDRVNPTGSITAPTGGSTVGGTVAVSSSDAADTASGVATVEFQERPGSSGGFTTIGTVSNPSPYTVNWNTTGVANGSYQLQAVITDRAGNTFTTPVVTVTVSNTFTVTSTTPQTAGIAFNVTITEKTAGVTNTSYNGSHTIVFTGPGTSSFGNAPSYPATVTFTNGVGTASVTLFKAETTTITATEGNVMGTSSNVVVNAKVASAMRLANCTVAGSSVTCGSNFALANSGTFAANIDIFDAYGNVPASTAVTINLSLTGNGSVFSFASGSAVTSTSVTVTGSGSPLNRSGQFSVFKRLTTNDTQTVSASATGYTGLSFTVSKN